MLLPQASGFWGAGAMSVEPDGKVPTVTAVDAATSDEVDRRSEGDAVAGRGEPGAVAASPIRTPDNHPKGLSVFIYFAGGTALAYLILAGVRSMPLPDWASHLLTSMVVVAIVHVLDRHVFVGETRSILEGVTQKTGEGIRENTRTALAKLQNDLASSVSQSVRDRTNELKQEISDETKNALAELQKDLASSVSHQARALLIETRDSLDEMLSRQSESLRAMSGSGMRSVYRGREEASVPMAEALTDPGNTTIRLMGVSLNDFVRGGEERALESAWIVLGDVILNGRRDAGEGKRLTIRVLIIDPDCTGARLRSHAETNNRPVKPVGRLESDVRNVAEALCELERKCKTVGESTGAGAQVEFACKLYRLAPIMFLCHVDSRCFVQQYHFWTDRISGTPVPVLEYGASGESPGAYPMHVELSEHFDLIWEHASVSVSDYLHAASIGTDKGMAQLGLVNIFTDREEAKARILYRLGLARKRVLLQGVSLQSFFSRGEISEAMYDLIGEGQVDIQVLILDRDCEQAAYRSYRERLLQQQDEEISFEEYRASGHRRSTLYRDTEETERTIRSWVSDFSTKNSPWECRLTVCKYASAPGCFMLAVDDVVFVEQYNYGKNVRPKPGRRSASSATLGTDMPLLEYWKDPPDRFLYQKEPADVYVDDRLRNPYDLQVDHFDFAFEQAEPVDIRAQTVIEPQGP